MGRREGEETERRGRKRKGGKGGEKRGLDCFCLYLQISCSHSSDRHTDAHTHTHTHDNTLRHPHDNTLRHAVAHT